MSLTPKQQRFVDEYLVDLNATQAAIRAGYSERTAGKIGSENLAKPEIADAIAAAQKDRATRTQITADRVLQELGRLAFFDIRKLYNPDGSMKNPAELDDETAAGLAGVDVTEQQTSDVDEEGKVRPAPTFTKKAKAFDKKGALELCMRHLGMLKDKVEHSGPDGKPLPVAQVAPIINVTLRSKG